MVSLRSTHPTRFGGTPAAVRPHSGVAIARQFIAARATERDGFIGPKLERLSFAELHHDVLI
jgi:hypothetical protein